MNFERLNWRIGRRLGAACALLLGLLLAITALAMSQAGSQQRQAAALHDQVLPAARLVHLLGQHVEEARGLEALHLLITSDAELSALEAQLAAHRQAVAARLRAYDQLVHGEADRRHRAAVQARLAAYWQAQDGVLAASRAAAASGALAPRLQARAQLTGPSQQAYAQLLQALDQWWAFNDQLAARSSAQASAAWQAILWLLGALALAATLALPALLALLAWAAPMGLATVAAPQLGTRAAGTVPQAATSASGDPPPLAGRVPPAVAAAAPAPAPAPAPAHQAEPPARSKAGADTLPA
jgi:hypothetical protein